MSSYTRICIPSESILLLDEDSAPSHTRKSTTTGHKKATQTNLLPNALVSLGLLPLLKSTATEERDPTKTTWAGSRSHETDIDLFKALSPHGSIFSCTDDQSRCSTVSNYANSKMLCFMFITELAHRVSANMVIINSVCPGMVKTEIADSTPIYVRAVTSVIIAMRARSPEYAGWIIV